MACLPIARAPRRGPIQVWRLTRKGNRTIGCVLRQSADSRFVVTVTLDGGEIASRCYSVRADAISHAGFLLERLTAGGWTVVAGMPQMVLH
jgi:hypothetical protein